MKQKMPKGVRFLFFLLSIVGLAIAFFASAFVGEIVSIVIGAVLGLVFILFATLIPKASKKKVMIFPLFAGIVLLIGPAFVTTVLAVGTVKNQIEKNNDPQDSPSNIIPPTYTYQEHYVSSPDTNIITKSEYFEIYETMSMAYSLESNPYRNATRNDASHVLPAAIEQTGRFDIANNPNAEIVDIPSILNKSAKSYVSSGLFDITYKLEEQGLEDTDVLENLFVEDSCYLNVYAYGESAYTFEYYKTFTFDGINLRVSQYIYFNAYGYLERQEILWVAHCDDMYSSSYKNQKVIVYEYTKKEDNNAK